MSTNDDRLIYYDWLADSATTSHVTNQRDAFINYEPLTNKLVLGVGNNETHAIGRGTVELESNFNGQKFFSERGLYDLPSPRLRKARHWCRRRGTGHH